MIISVNQNWKWKEIRDDETKLADSQHGAWNIGDGGSDENYERVEELLVCSGVWKVFEITLSKKKICECCNYWSSWKKKWKELTFTGNH